LRNFGASVALDRVYFSANIPLALAGLVSGSLLYLLPPRFTQITPRVQDSTVRVLFILFAIVCSVAVLVELAFGFIRDQIFVAVLGIGFTLVALLMVLCTLFTCTAQARGSYLSTGIAPMIISTGLLGGVMLGVAFHAEWGLLIGYFLGSTVASLWLGRTLGMVFLLRWRDLILARAALRKLKPHLVNIVMGTMAFTLFQPIDVVLCSSLSGGSLSLMSYAQRVVVAASVAVNLGSHTIAALTARESLLEGGERALKRLANHEVLRIVGFGLLVWMGFTLLGGHRLLGALLSSSAMVSNDFNQLVECMQWMLLGVGPMAAIPYLFRIFYSQNVYDKPAILGIFVALTYGFLSWLLIPRFGILALAYVYSAVWWLTLLAAIVWLNWPSAGE